MEALEIQQHLRKMLSTLADVRHRFKYDVKKLRIMEIDDMLSKDSMWSDACMMHKLMQERSSLHKSIDHLSALAKDIESAIEIIDIANDDDEIHDILLEIGKNLEPWNKQINSLRIASVFNNKEDYLDCFVEINAGAGGTDSQDWVEIMLRMYISWANSKGFKTKISHRMEGDEAGLKQVIFSISGHLAFGYMKFENGIHRLVRLSPFNASNKRQTSFASVFCYPSTDDKIDIKIDEKDLRVDTYRSSGAGGQHVNKTDSAVRITHLLTGIAVQSQNQRSQIQNRAEAMKILKARLYDLELQKLSANRDAVESKKSEIAWSNQIRNYVMHPYQLVKDVRSNYETAQISKILDGDLDELMESVIMCNI